MSREIEFRAFDNQTNKMLFHKLGESHWYTSENKAVIFEFGDHHETALKTRLSTPMQYTGLKDSKGVKVFEGDIVVKNCYLFFDNGKPNYRGVVEWIYSQWQVVLYCINPEKGGISDGINEGLNDEGFEEGANSDWEVIGNIYQNTELLEVQND